MAAPVTGDRPALTVPRRPTRRRVRFGRPKRTAWFCRSRSIGGYRRRPAGRPQSHNPPRIPLGRPTRRSTRQGTATLVNGGRARDHVPVAETGLVVGHRAWFYDQRSPARRMSVSAHPDEGIIVLALWQGDRCTGSFRMPLAQAASVISALAAGMSAGLPSATSEPPRTLGHPSASSWLRRLSQQLRRRVPERSPNLRSVQ